MTFFNIVNIGNDIHKFAKSTLEPGGFCFFNVSISK
jgi:hypothetical protein